MRLQLISVGVVLVMLWSPTISGQTGQTIPEMVAAGGGWGGPSVPSGVRPGMMAGVLNRTDTLVRGIVGEPHPSYLSEDQREVFTDYPILSPTVLYQETLALSDRPGIVKGIAVAVRGGSILVNGIPFTAKYDGQPQLKPGTEYLFLLRKDKEKYRVVGDYYGIFGTVDGRFGPLFRPSEFAQEYVDLGIDAAAERMVALLHSKNRVR
jgi:hypothetical protein